MADATRWRAARKSSAVLAEPLEPRRLLAAVSWDGGGDGVRWADPLNWSGDALPGSADDVLLAPPTGSVAATDGVLIDQAVPTVGSLVAETPLQLGEYSPFPTLPGLIGELAVLGSAHLGKSLTLVNESVLACAELLVGGSLTVTESELHGELMVVTGDTQLNWGNTVAGHLLLKGDVEFAANLAQPVWFEPYEGESTTIELSRDTAATFRSSPPWFVAKSGSGHRLVNRGEMQFGYDGPVTFDDIAFENFGSALGYFSLAGGGSNHGTLQFTTESEIIGEFTFAAGSLTRAPQRPLFLRPGGQFTAEPTARLEGMSLFVEQDAHLQVDGDADLFQLWMTGGTLTGSGDVATEYDVQFEGGEISGTGELHVGRMLRVYKPGTKLLARIATVQDDLFVNGYDGAVLTLGRATADGVEPGAIISYGDTSWPGPLSVNAAHPLNRWENHGRVYLYKLSGLEAPVVDFGAVSFVNHGTVELRDAHLSASATYMPEGRLEGQWLLQRASSLDVGSAIREVAGTLKLLSPQASVPGLHALESVTGELLLASETVITPASGLLRHEGLIDLQPGGMLSIHGELYQSPNAQLRVTLGAARPESPLIDSSAQVQLNGTVQLDASRISLPYQDRLPLVRGETRVGAASDPDFGTMAISADGRQLYVTYDETALLAAVAPLRPSSPHIDASDDTGISSSDGHTRLQRPALVGTASEGDRVRVYHGSTLLGEASVVDGTWRVVPPEALPDGNYRLHAVAVDPLGGESLPSGSTDVTIDTQPPSHVESSFDVDAQQLIRVTFDENVFPSRLTLANLTNGAVLREDQFTVGAGSSNSWGLRPDRWYQGYLVAPFPDGNWRLHVPAGDAPGAPTDRAGNRLPDEIVFDFFVLAGDATRDRKVDFSDFLILRSNFGRTDNPLFSKGDFNYDRKVDFADFLILRGNFGKSLPPPSTGSLFAGENEDDGETTDGARSVLL